MGKNRDSLRIVAAILDASQSGARKTHIMYTANLSFQLLEKYLAVAVQAGFVQSIGYEYRLTESGQDFLLQYKRFFERYDHAQKLFDELNSEREKLAGLFKRSESGSSVDPVTDAQQVS